MRRLADPELFRILQSLLKQDAKLTKHSALTHISGLPRCL